MFARRPGQDNTLAPVMMGSHLDTQPTGGKFDGALGVLGALEVVRSLNDLNIRTQRPIEVANWTNEEGSRYAPAMIVVGRVRRRLSPRNSPIRARTPTARRSATNSSGSASRATSLSAAIPCTPSSSCISSRARSSRTRSIDVGVVTHGQGQRWYEIRLTGFESHAGSTPMPRRKDALLGAARIVELVNAIGLVEGAARRCRRSACSTPIRTRATSSRAKCS